VKARSPSISAAQPTAAPGAVPHWALPIDGPPSIRHAAAPVHGQIPVERWRALGFWCVHAYRYRARLRMDDAWYDLQPGMVSLFPPSIDLEYRYEGPSPHAYVHFDLAPSRSGALPSVPALVQLGGAFEPFDADLRECIAWVPHQPDRARARVWDLLWRLTDLAAQASGDGLAGSGGPPARGMPPVVRRAVEWIEVRLAEPMQVSTLAAELDISHAHLVRLFRRHIGTAPLAYARQRRARRAEHLLRCTTWPAKSIAAQVGLADLHQLNKLLRQCLGRSPREIRGGAAVRAPR
jgi:AraC-like DNA-binding protein